MVKLYINKDNEYLQRIRSHVIVPNTINLRLILTLNQQTRHLVLLAT